MPSTSKRFPYFKFYPRDWLEGTRGMSLEERGAYIDLICMMMEEEGHLRDDEKSIAFQMHVSTRKWRSVRERLVEHKKIHVEGGLIVQERCLKELDSLLVHRQTKSESATNRERTKREKPKLVSNINDTDTTVVPLRARVTSDSDSDKKDPPVSPPVGDAVRQTLSPALVAAAMAATIAAGSFQAAAQPPEQPALFTEQGQADAQVPAKPKKERRRSAAVPETYSTDFEEFWKIYPRREGKGGAFKAWGKLTMDQRRKAWLACKTQAPVLAAKMSDRRGNFCPLPATWINDGRFDDDAASLPKPVAPPAPGVNGSNYSFSGQYVGQTF